MEAIKMSLKLALLLLFGFVSLAVAVPLEDTEEKAEPVGHVAADEKVEASLKESEDDEIENGNKEDAEQQPEINDNEEDPENKVEANDEDAIVKRLYRRRCVITRRKCLNKVRCKALSHRPWQSCCLPCRPIKPIKKCLYCRSRSCGLIGCRYYGCFWRVVN